MTAGTPLPSPPLAAQTDEALLARFKNARRRPPASDTLGFEMLRVEQERMEIEVAFIAPVAFTNPAGQIQGGFLCAMLDETMSVAAVVASGMSAFVPTLEMKTSFFRPAKPGRLHCVGRVARWGKTIAFLEGELYDDQRRILAKATSTAMPQPYASIRPPAA